MAKITIEVDTEKKTITADVDGKKYKDIYSVHCFNSKSYDKPDESMIDVSIDLKPREENGIKYYSYIIAYGSQLAQSMLSSIKYDFVDNSKHIIEFSKRLDLSQAISNLLGYNKK